jgi:hypothetical protein
MIKTGYKPIIAVFNFLFIIEGRVVFKALVSEVRHKGVTH